MPDSITIKVLSDEDFDGLGYEATRGADISGSLGFADKLNNRIFVRDTGVDMLNKYLVNHEVEHLFEAEGTDEDAEVPGIRHKFWLIPILAAAAAATTRAVQASTEPKHRPPDVVTSPITEAAGAGARAAGEAATTGLLSSASRQSTSPQVSFPTQQAQPQPQPESRMTELARNVVNVSQPGAATSPLNLFGSGTSVASPRAFDFQPGLNSGIGGGLTPEQLERRKGQYAGRLVF